MSLQAGRLSASGQQRKSRATTGMSGPGGEADLIGEKADMADQMSAFGGKAGSFRSRANFRY